MTAFDHDDQMMDGLSDYRNDFRNWLLGAMRGLSVKVEVVPTEIGSHERGHQVQGKYDAGGSCDVCRGAAENRVENEDGERSPPGVPNCEGVFALAANSGSPSARLRFGHFCRPVVGFSKKIAEDFSEIMRTSPDIIRPRPLFC